MDEKLKMIKERAVAYTAGAEMDVVDKLLGSR